jgi:hypothetical protein
MQILMASDGTCDINSFGSRKIVGQMIAKEKGLATAIANPLI